MTPKLDRPGPKRRHNPAIPAHIDQARLPAGVYFDARGRGRWYVQYRDEAGRLRRNNIADAQATLSELHRIVEQRNGIDRESLRFLASQFHQSAQFKELAARSQQDYEYCRQVLIDMPTKLGKPLGDLATRQFKPALVQRIVDKIAAEGTPAKANHLLRYLRRLFRWGINRGYCDSNPAQGVESAKERRQRRLPESETIKALTDFARERGRRTRGEKGACAPYLCIVMELAYICRLRGIEVVTLTDANCTVEGVLTNRRKGSRDSVIRWYPRLRAAWNAAVERRELIWKNRGKPVPMHPEERPLIVAADGDELRKSSLDTAWQRLIKMAIEEGIIAKEDRFGLHDLKRRGITDTKGTRHEKQEASGHRSPAMMDVYDLSIPLVQWPGEE
ncbi:site-specific integrase [Billgrantia gudaonensis]|uniref:Phage integrase central domain-containing protein n=1 Tax=Billgrantia gudaonensis TaxID=376427 RepID=A0A1G9E3T3_9GAMM|nr:integrase [Halomonas gudaonensis]SDK70760.1 hypothetical protein SAMN04487954_12417 [Halomonas gudaonensis]